MLKRFINGGHGYSALSNVSYETIKNSVTTLFGGVYANNKVPDIINRYLSSKNLTATTTVNWNPTSSIVYNEIAAGRPCLVGFAAGSSYSQVVGHMTMCCGVENVSNGIMLALVDGHSSTVVYRLWSSHNDCVITSKIN